MGEFGGRRKAETGLAQFGRYRIGPLLFIHRKFVNRDADYGRYLAARGDEAIDDAPTLYRPDSRTRIFEMQIIQQGLWAGFNVVVLSGFRVRNDVLRNVESNTTFVRAMVGF